MFPDTALHDSEYARSQMWLLFFNVGPQTRVTPSNRSIAAAADVHLFFFFFWNLLCILSGLLADTENPIFVSDYWRLTSAPSVLFRVSELAHFPSMLIQSFSTHFGQSPLAVLLYGSHAFGLAVCQRWGACPGSRCIDRPLFHVHLTPWGAVFKLYVFAIEFMLL